jgi:thiamine-monophosphate kinase
MPRSEKSIIRAIRRTAGTRKSALLRVGIGDDCAVLRVPAGHEALITTDFSLEDVHFRRDWHAPEVVGHRCLTRGLSDIAAMGGEPVAAFLSLALPARLPQKWVDGFVKGLLRLANQFEISLAGGDIAQSPGGILADIVVTGSVPTGKAMLRSGARVGDEIYVTGELGGSAAAIERLRQGKALRSRDYPQHFAPKPRVEVGRVLRGRGLAAAMIDVSDGLSTDLGHICEESGVGAELEVEAVPVARVGNPRETVDLNFALHGGDDYELLFTAPAAKRIPNAIAGVAVTRIGRIVHGSKMFMTQNGKRRELKAQGWEHFAE